MTVVWLLAALLVVATVWFLARAVRSAPARPAPEDYDGKVQLRDRLLAQLRELDVEEADRNVDATIATDERQRLEAELAQVLRDLENSTGEPASQAASGSSRPLWFATVFVLALTVPLVSASLYLLKNGSTLGRLNQAGSTTVAGDAGQAPGAAPKNLPPMVLKMVGRLEARLKEQPNDPQGWARLARSYQVLGRQDDARQAYARAYELAPDDTQVVSAYAGFLMSSSPSHMSAQTIAVFRRLHALEPKHPGALWALGFAAYQEKHFAQAVKYWEQLLALLPPNHEAVAQLQHALSIARAEAAKAKK
jgi:cytochrome c-type biogenesis protein CcmH